jgi:CheY-like chemotaxis protein
VNWREFSALVVDDDEMVRVVLARSVRLYSKDVTVACDGRQALSLLEERHFDVVISDLRMPGMTGLELAEQLIVHKPKTRMLVVTGFTRRQDEQKLLELGVRILHKPFGPDELKLALLRVLEMDREPPG